MPRRLRDAYQIIALIELRRFHPRLLKKAKTSFSIMKEDAKGVKKLTWRGKISPFPHRCFKHAKLVTRSAMTVG